MSRTINKAVFEFFGCDGGCWVDQHARNVKILKFIKLTEYSKAKDFMNAIVYQINNRVNLKKSAEIFFCKVIVFSCQINILSSHQLR